MVALGTGEKKYIMSVGQRMARERENKRRDRCGCRHKEGMITGEDVGKRRREAGRRHEKWRDRTCEGEVKLKRKGNIMYLCL